MINRFKWLTKNLLNCLYPQVCLNCLNHCKDPICTDCQVFLKPPQMSRCKRCGIFIPTTTQSHKPCFSCKNRSVLYIEAPLIYKDEVADAIQKFKYKHQLAWSKIFAQAMYDNCQEYIKTFDLIIPVPLHRSRLRERGFNQSEEISKNLSLLSNIPTKNYIHRQRKTQAQASLKRKDRLKNLENAFECTNKTDNMRILILDDVTTTGTTLYKCAQAIKKAKFIGGISVARRL